MRQVLMIIISSLILHSCGCFTKNISLGEKFKLSEFSIKETSIMYCFDDCCNSGYTIIPQTIIEYNFNKKWIIAKSDTTYHNNDLDFAYWIFKKDTSSEDEMYKLIKANLIGPLDSITFYKTLRDKRIELQLIKY